MRRNRLGVELEAISLKLGWVLRGDDQGIDEVLAVDGAYVFLGFRASRRKVIDDHEEALLPQQFLRWT